MKQPKDDDRYEVKSPRITKKQHIVPKKIIKKWKQNVVIKGQPENCPFDIKFRKGKEERPPQSEGSKCFWVNHRWTQNVEKWKEKIEKDFYQLVDEYEKSQCNLIIDNRKQKEQEIILHYFYTMMTCNDFKSKKGNSYVKLKKMPSLSNKKKATIQQIEQEVHNRDLCEECYVRYVDSDGKTDMSSIISSLKVGLKINCLVKNKNDPRAIWYYIKTKERLFLPDNWDNYGIISISPHSILISQDFINDLGKEIDLQKLDINNPPICCKKVISFVKIMNDIALSSYDKWIIF